MSKALVLRKPTVQPRAPAKQQRAQKPKKSKQSIPKSVVGGLDAAATAYKRLLEDPCGAPLTNVPFAGTGSGYLVRTRTVINPAATNKDLLVTFAPSYNGTAAGVTSSCGPIAYWGADTSGNALTGGYHLRPGFIGDGSNIVGQYRCVAGCLRLTYTGTELNRGGMVYGGISTENPWQLTNEYPTSTSSTGTGQSVATTMTALAQSMTRLGSKPHEVRWLPGDADQRWTGKDAGDTITRSNYGNCASIGVVNMVNAASGGGCMVEVIAVWEWVPEVGGFPGTPTGIVNTPSAPKSSSTLNHVLRAIGSVADFVHQGLEGGGMGMVLDAAARFGGGKFAGRAMFSM